MGNLYGKKWIGYGYDFLASLIWLPSKNKLYDKCVKLTGIQKNDTVLELGCGTGYLTRKLEKQHALVTAVDQSAGMLARAGERNSATVFIESDILKYCDVVKYNYVVFFFVLHELSAAQRATALKAAHGFLKAKGQVIICDFAIPDKGIRRFLFPRILRLWEPESTVELLQNGFDADLKDTQLNVTSRVKLQRGRVQLLKLVAATS